MTIQRIHYVVGYYPGSPELGLRVISRHRDQMAAVQACHDHTTRTRTCKVAWTVHSVPAPGTMLPHAEITGYAYTGEPYGG